MRDRNEALWRIVCLVLTLLVAWQVVNAVIRAGSLARVKIPAAPGLAADEPAAGKAPKTPPLMANGTNLAAAKASTNAVAANTVGILAASGTNRSPLLPATNPVAVVAAAPAETNAPVPGTNLPAVSSNPPALAVVSNSPVSAKTNSAPSATVTTNTPHSGAMPHGAIMTGMSGAPFATRGGAGRSLPPEVHSRVDKITDSEILGPVMHPLPLGLMGIAGEVAFLRTASGQTGLVKAGDTLGDVKLLRIGINRVLVAVGGQTNELTIFEGYGGESLLPERKETPP